MSELSLFFSSVSFIEDVKIGNNATIGAGAIVKKEVREIVWWQEIQLRKSVQRLLLRSISIFSGLNYYVYNSYCSNISSYFFIEIAKRFDTTE